MLSANPSPLTGGDGSHDFTLYTDGSGHQDGYSGWCAYAVNNHTQETRHAVGCLTSSSVDRAEFTALLEGLELVHSMALTTQMSLKAIRGKPKIFWYSDRESLVGGVARKWGDHAGRKAQPDLWRRFEHYEDKFIITAQHVARETEFALFQKCDLHASSLRIVIKSYDTDNC